MWRSCSTACLFSALLCSSLAAQSEPRALTEREVQTFIQLFELQLAQVGPATQALQAMEKTMRADQQLLEDVLASRVDPRAWLSARKALPSLPLEAKYEAACSRSLGATPADMPDAAYRSDLASPTAVFVLPWSGTKVAWPSNPLDVPPAAQAAYARLQQGMKDVVRQWRGRGWNALGNFHGIEYLVSPDTTVVLTVRDRIGFTEQCAAIGGGYLTGPIITVQAMSLHRPDIAETWEEALERVGWDDRRFGDTLFQLRMTRQFVIGSEEAELYRMGGIVPPPGNLALYRKHAGRLDPLFDRWEALYR